LEEELTDLRVREAVRHVQARLLGLDQTRASQHLQMVRGRRDTLAGLTGEGIHRPWALRQEVEELETVRAARGLANPGDLFVDRRLQ
jgi:hypothetical protein